jgi:hypothetical protein
MSWNKSSNYNNMHGVGSNKEELGNFTFLFSYTSTDSLFTVVNGSKANRNGRNI